VALVEAFQEVINPENGEFIDSRSPRALVGTFVLAEGWNLEHRKWLYFMESDCQPDRELRAERREWRFVTKLPCLSARFVDPGLLEEKTMTEQVKIGQRYHPSHADL